MLTVAKVTLLYRKFNAKLHFGEGSGLIGPEFRVQGYLGPKFRVQGYGLSLGFRVVVKATTLPPCLMHRSWKQLTYQLMCLNPKP